MPMTVKELAKALEIKTKEVMKVLLELGSPIDGPQSTVEDQMIDKAADLIWRRFNKPEGGRFRLAAEEEEQAPAEAKEDKPAEEPKPKAEPEPQQKPEKQKEAKPQKEPAVASKAEEKKKEVKKPKAAEAEKKQPAAEKEQPVEVVKPVEVPQPEVKEKQQPKKKAGKTAPPVSDLELEKPEPKAGKGKKALEDKPRRAKPQKGKLRRSIAPDEIDLAVPETKEDGFAPPVEMRSSKAKSRKAAKKKQQAQPKQKAIIKPKPTKVKIPESLTVKDLAGLMGIEAAAIIKKLMELGMMININQYIDQETAALVATEFNLEVELEEIRDETELPVEETEDREEDLVERPPVVTIMGHVDHGKTSLLDAIRESRVTATEAGGITQHIGAYQVDLDGKKITFLDTPGHEAFTSMRARGAQATDIAVLVVAADDGVMPQTVEAINHAKAADVPIIVAINKIDKPTANPDRVKQELTEHQLVPEEWGGETICVPVSALRKEGIDQLLEMILLVAEIRELKANPKRMASGIVIEAKLDKGRGPVATVLVQNGTLRIGDSVLVGEVAGKIRAMFNENGEGVKEAGPAMPVEILGLDSLPEAGDTFQAVEDDKLARYVADKRSEKRREEEMAASSRISLDELFAQAKEGEIQQLNIVLKADVQGSAEAVRQSLEQLSTEEVKVQIIHSAAGAISDSDVMLAAASGAIVIGFNVRPDSSAKKLAERENVEIRLYRVIYDAIEDMKAALAGLLKPEEREVILGQAEVRATFRVPKVGVVAGCYVTEGKVLRSANARIIRDGIVIYEGKLSSLKRFKDDVREVTEGYECGIGIERYNDIKEGDILEFFQMQQEQTAV